MVWPHRNRQQTINADLTMQARLFSLDDLLERERILNEWHIRTLCRTVTLDEQTAVTRVLGRWKMYVDPRDIAISIHLMFDGYWEIWLTEEIARVVQPGMIVADIGANLGYFTLLMADLVGPDGRVLAFEPNPHMAELLRRSLVANGFSERAEIAQEPLSHSSGEEIRLNFDREHPGAGFIASYIHDGRDESLPMMTRRFDDHPLADRVAVAKIDVEGSEQAVWTGMTRALAGDALRTVFLEWSGCRYSDPAAFLHELVAPGFSLSALDPWRGIEPTSIADLLAQPMTREWLLVLRR